MGKGKHPTPTATSKIDLAAKHRYIPSFPTIAWLGKGERGGGKGVRRQTTG